MHWVARRRQDLVPDTLILTEHHPVFTVGVRPGADAHVVWDASTRQRLGVDLVRTNRGGDVTFHGPGQVVGYPIVSLREKRDLHLYLRSLEEVLINTLGNLGLAASRRPGMTGIWLEKRKVAAIGVAVKGWVTMHGFALNVEVDLRYFSGIVPCGIVDGTVTSLHRELSPVPPVSEIKEVLALEFWRVFRDFGHSSHEHP